MANEGFLYEEKINKILKKAGIQDKSFQPAASDSNAPDGVFTYKGIEYKLEIKLNLKVDFGQGSLDYDVKTKKWCLGGAATASAQAMRDFLTKMKVPQIVNKVWGPKGAPRKFTVPLDRYKKEDVDADYKRFSEQKIRVPEDAIANYYASKKTYYIQIGGKGLYYMGKDPAGLGCPEFKPETILRIRIKRAHTNPLHAYRFVTALVVPRLEKSNVDLDNEKDLAAIAARAAG